VPSTGSPAVADRVGVGRLIVGKADQLEAEFAVIEDAVRDHSPEVARADDEYVPQADAGAPAALQQIANDLARGVRQRDGEPEEQQPHRA
jgi:hypothetical protein